MERYDLEVLVQHIAWARSKIQCIDYTSPSLVEMDCNSALQALDAVDDMIRDNLGTGDESRIFTDAAAHGYTVPAAADLAEPVSWGSDGDWTRAAGTVGPWLLGVGLAGIVTCAILAMVM